MTRVNFAFKSGLTLKAKVRTEAGAYRESDITLTETPAGKGLYIGASVGALTVGDNVNVYDVVTSDISPVGHGEYDFNGTVLESDIAVVQDSDMTILKSDIAAVSSKIASDVTILKSDITNIDTGVDSDVTIVVSNLNSILSDLVVISNKVGTVTHEFHL